jgi:hypothetical protein
MLLPDDLISNTEQPVVSAPQSVLHYIQQLRRNNWICGVFQVAVPVYDGLAAFSLPVPPEKAALMEVKLYVRNLPGATTGSELDALFARAGEVTSVDLITDRRTGRSRGYAYVTMSTQNEADKAVSLFNAYALDDHKLKVALVKPRQQPRSVMMD